MAILQHLQGVLKKPKFGRVFHVFSTRNFFLRNDPIRASFMQGIDCAHFSGGVKYGQRSVFMLRECAQSIPRLEKHKNRRFSHKNPKMLDFRFNTSIPSLNQGSVFKGRECAQSIFRIELPLYY